MKTASRTISRRSTSRGASSESPQSKLQKLFEDELKDIYWAEKSLIKAIPKMVKKATSEELISTLDDHLGETQEQIHRIEEIFGLIGKEPQTRKCEAMAGLIKETEEMMANADDGMMLDAGIISSTQKVEHYEIASYGTLRTFAATLGLDDVVTLLQQTLDEEKNADEKLTEVAVTSINEHAAEEVEDEE